MRLEWGATSHKGLVRKRNEDAIVATPSLFAVADGMGGHADGNVASELTAAALRSIGEAGNLQRADVLRAIRIADAELAALGADQTNGMGTTVTGIAVLVAEEPTLLVFNVGDSRCYRLRNGALVQLTHDHSVVQELVDAGDLTMSEAEVHPERNVITRSLGSDEQLDIDWWLTEPMASDRFLICSDGLFKELAAEAIADVLARAADAGSAVDGLLTAALDAGGRDNVSVVVVDVLDAAPESGALDDDTAPRSAGIDADTSVPVVRLSDPESGR